MPTVTSDDIIAYVVKHTKIEKHLLSCHRLVKKDTPENTLKRVNFKLGVSENLLELLLNPDIWPENVTVRPFRFFNERKVNQ